MAKRKPIRDHRKQKRRPASAATLPTPEHPHPGPKLWQAVTISHPVNHSISGKRGVEEARQKHTTRDLADQPSHGRPTLADRFNALPSELRAAIFSILVVRPVKWDVEHVRVPDDEHISHETSIQNVPECGNNCATDALVKQWRIERHLGLDIWQSPWRSDWAPPQLNPYVCTFCYDKHLREEPFPKPKSLPCLCARRRNLETLLVCKQWYEEAATVFYTQNIFGFEDLSVFVEFAKNLNPKWRRVISKISILTLSAALPPPNEDRTVHPTPNEWLSWTWHQLNNFPSLSYLELDSTFLTRTKTVRALLRLRLSRLRQVCFASHLPVDEIVVVNMTCLPTRVWPRLAQRQLVRGGFAEKVARAVKGQRTSVLLGRESHKAIKEGIQQVNAEQQALESLSDS